MNTLARHAIMGFRVVVTTLYGAVIAFGICAFAGTMAKLMWYALTFGWNLLP